jgi:acetylglutamate kinase
MSDKSDNISIQTNINDEELNKKANILCEALPYMRRFAGETFVIKFGGSAMGGDKNLKNFAKNVVLLKQVGINPIVVHGGGPQIGAMLEKLGRKNSIVMGFIITVLATAAIGLVDLVNEE